ncbi:DUF4232 domain-containing protein [Streptomyces sp. NPDC006990]|uniref:DUF4232 domain-containing protein n=1 Tax=unclassified Streptomyces TaxID=2593676 RepID=UPI0034543AC0
MTFGVPGTADTAYRARRAPGRSWRRVRAAAGTVLLLAAVAACGGGDDADGKDPGPGDSPPASAADGAPGSSAPATGGGHEAAGGGARRCAASDLTMSLDPAESPAGSRYFDVALKNTTDAACLLKGYPRVSLTGEDGAAIGSPAAHAGGAGRTVTVQPSTRAHAKLRTRSEDAADGSCWAKPGSVEVRPPGSDRALTAEVDGLRVCGGLFTVTALEW